MKRIKLYLSSLLCLILCGLQTLQANTIDAPLCTVNVSGTSLREVISIIEKQTNYHFLQSASDKVLNQPITLSEKNQPLTTVLRKLGTQSGLTFEIEGTTIYVKTLKKQQSITGKVTDAGTGQTIPGVSVGIKGTQKRTVTDDRGSYEITAGEGDILQFSFMGYKTYETAASRAVINVALQDDQSELNEVVVVGYGTQSRKALSTSVTKVSQDEFNKGGFSNPAQLLQGKVAGLNITRSGDPNATPSISLRGPSTLRTGAAQEPFYVINGVPGADFRLVSPDDIEDISVLKDASATAIYGTRASNGVILITTKSGKDGTSTISYNGYTGVENISNTLDMMTAGQLTDYLKKNNVTLDPSDAKGANTDWQKEISRSGFLQNHNVALSGGYKNTQYSAGINYFDNKGILQGSDLNRLIGRLNLTQSALNDHLKLGLNFSNSSSTSDIIPNQDLVLYNALRFLPTVPVMQNGVYTENLQRVQYYNPVSLLNNAQDRIKTTLSLLNVTAQVKLPYGFKYDVSLSTQKELNNGGIYYNSTYTLFPGFNGQAYRSAYENSRKTAETFLTFDKVVSKHSLNVLAGYSIQQDVNNDGFQANNQNFPSDDQGYSNIGLGSPPANFKTDWGTNSYEKLRLISFFGRFNYNYANKYILQASVRRDASSAFGVNNRWGTFPAVSAAWRITEESFMKSQNIFQDLKARVGYGITGNSLGFNPLISKVRYGASGSFYNNGNYNNAIGVVQNSNPDLKWEKTAMFNAAIDASILKGRLNFTAEYYNKKTSDLIWGYPVSSTQYYASTYTANVGSISNKGVELTVDARVIQTKDFKWSSSFNVSHNKNLLLSLSNDKFKLDSIPQAAPGGQGQTGTTVQILKPGYPVGEFFTFKYAGLNAAGVSQYYGKDGKLTTAPKEYTDYYYAGSAQPKAILGWGNTFTYKRFDLNIFLRSSLGGKVFNATLADLNRPADGKTYNLPVYSGSENVANTVAYRYSDRYIENASYLRVDNATLGYTLPKIKGIQSLRFYVTSNNVAVITGYKGIDPEISMGGLTPGIDNKNYYPRTRSFLFGANLSF